MLSFSKYLCRTVDKESFSLKLGRRQGCKIFEILTSTIIQEKIKGVRSGEEDHYLSLYT